MGEETAAADLERLATEIHRAISGERGFDNASAADVRELARKLVARHALMPAGNEFCLRSEQQGNEMTLAKHARDEGKQAGVQVPPGASDRPVTDSEARGAEGNNPAASPAPRLDLETLEAAAWLAEKMAEEDWKLGRKVAYRTGSDAGMAHTLGARSMALEIAAAIRALKEDTGT